MNKETSLLQKLLKENIKSLNLSVKHLKYSYQKCKNINLNNNLTETELETLEALASRFSRTSDILTQKVLKTIILLNREDAPTFMDRINLLEKINYIDNKNDLLEIRDLRNNITHEYNMDENAEIFSDILINTELLIKIIKDILVKVS